MINPQILLSLEKDQLQLIIITKNIESTWNNLLIHTVLFKAIDNLYHSATDR